MIPLLLLLATPIPATPPPATPAVLNEAASFRATGEEDVLTLEPLLDLMHGARVEQMFLFLGMHELFQQQTMAQLCSDCRSTAMVCRSYSQETGIPS